MHTFNYTLKPTDKAKKMGQRPLLIWLTGLSASGKSSLANELDILFHQEGFRSVVLDGDSLRHGINNDLGFTEKDRSENIRRTAEIGKLFLQAGFIVIAPLISPKDADRSMAKNIIGEDDFFLVHLDTKIEICEERDPKGLYAKARKNELLNFTGIHQPYEKPTNAQLIFKDNFNIEEAAQVIFNKYKGIPNI